MGDPIDTKSIEAIMAALKEGVAVTQTGVYIEVTGSELKMLYEKRAKELRSRAAKLEASASKPLIEEDEPLFIGAQTITQRRHMARTYIEAILKGAECAEFVAGHIDTARICRLHATEISSFFTSIDGQLGGCGPRLAGY